MRPVFGLAFASFQNLSDLPDDPSEDSRLLHEFSLALFNAVALGATGDLPNGPVRTPHSQRFQRFRLSADLDRMRDVLPEVAKWPLFAQTHPNHVVQF